MYFLGLRQTVLIIEILFVSFWQPIKPCGSVGMRQNFAFSFRSNWPELCNRHIVGSRRLQGNLPRVNLSGDWSFIGGSKIVMKPNATRLLHYPKRGQMQASCNPLILQLLIFKLILKITCVLCWTKFI